MLGFYPSIYFMKKNNEKVPIQLKISAMKQIIGSNKMNDGDKNSANLSTLKNNTKLCSKSEPSVNINPTASQNTKKAIIVIIVMKILFVLLREERLNT